MKKMPFVFMNDFRNEMTVGDLQESSVIVHLFLYRKQVLWMDCQNYFVYIYMGFLMIISGYD